MRLSFADLVWPALLLENRLLTWWAILVGLFVEYFFVRRITNLSFSRAVLADVSMNAVSALLGIILIPIAGLIWELFPGSVYMAVFHVGTFNPGTWVATALIAAILNTYIERFALRRLFKQPLLGRRAFWLLYLANAISVSLALASLFYWPPKPP